MKMVLNILIALIFTGSALLAQWLPQVSGTTQNLNSINFINTQTGYSAGLGGIIVKTVNGGNTWNVLSSGTSAEIKNIFVTNANDAFACGNGGMIIKTVNGGLNWTAMNTGVTDNLLGIYFKDSSGVCCGNGTIIYTTNYGSNWLIGQTGYMVTYNSAFMYNRNWGWVAGVNTIFSPLVGRTSNGGINWTYSSFYINSNEGTLRDIYFFDSLKGIAVSNTWNGGGGVSVTTNSGQNWTSQLLTNPLYGVDFPSFLTGYAAGYNGYIVKTTDGGITWIQQTYASGTFFRSVDFTDTLTGWICGDNGTILKTTNGGITSLKLTEKDMPNSFRLEQNYPNPFNPATKIKFSVGKSPYSYPSSRGVHITLVIYNSQGQNVKTLVSHYLHNGEYEVEWNAIGYPSGVYFYILAVGEYIETRRMVLVK